MTWNPQIEIYESVLKYVLKHFHPKMSFTLFVFWSTKIMIYSVGTIKIYIPRLGAVQFFQWLKLARNRCLGSRIFLFLLMRYFCPCKRKKVPYFLSRSLIFFFFSKKIFERFFQGFLNHFPSKKSLRSILSSVCSKQAFLKALERRLTKKKKKRLQLTCMVNILVRGNHHVGMKSGYCAKATLLYYHSQCTT